MSMKVCETFHGTSIRGAMLPIDMEKLTHMDTMLFRFSLLASACLLALTTLGCASQQSQKSASSGTVVCERYLPTGSHLTRARCVKKEDVEARRESDRETIRDIQIGSNLDPSANSGN